MAGTRADFLYRLRKELGFVEGPNNWNPYAAEVGHANNQPWCASFVAAMAKRAGVALPSTSAYTPTMANGFKRIDRFDYLPRIGSLVFFEWPNMGRIAHVGVVEAIRDDGALVTIEGNTDSAGGRTGGRVMRQVRRANIAGYGHPDFTPEVEPKPVPLPERKPRMIIRFSNSQSVYEVVGSHLEHVNGTAFKARGLKPSDVTVLPPTHPLAKLPVK